MPVVVDLDATKSHSRLALVVLAGLNLRMLEIWRRTQLEAWDRTLDHESTMIMLAVVVIRGQKAVRSGSVLELSNLKNAIPQEFSTKCNLLSIASATGLNRETVRRKVRRLEGLGLLARTNDGGMTIPTGTLESERMEELLISQLEALRLTFDNLARSGVLKSSAGPAVTGTD